jgi:CheY-like chemotaxis protein
VSRENIPIRALVVDDEPSICSTMALILKSLGFDVQTASSAKDAKAYLAQSQFDLVITDLSMETETAGYDVLKAASQQRPSKPATVVISGYPDILSKWKDEGADAGLQKPTEVHELLSIIERLLPDRA